MVWGNDDEETKLEKPASWITYEECLKLGVNPLGRSELRSKLTRYKASFDSEWELRRVWFEDDVLALAERAP